MKLYDYYRSSASYRVRIALNIKNIRYERMPVHLIQEGGEQNLPLYRELNPQGLVPTLIANDQIITQSLAIIEYLEEIEPAPPLLPKDALGRAMVRSMALLIACETHPLNNLKVLNYLRHELQCTEIQVKTWYHHWLKQSFDALEQRLTTSCRKQKLCYGNTVSIADIFLIPQVYNAHRFEFSMSNYPLINEIYEHCCGLDAFKKAEPESLIG